MISLTKTRSPPVLNGYKPSKTKSLLDSDHGITLQTHYEKKGETSCKLAHTTFEVQAARYPEAVAVQFEQTIQVTYHQLNSLANYVARHLVCGRGSIIPIMVERSINLVVALLAVLKTGAAYVLLSGESPVERTRFIIEDTRAPFIIVNALTQGKSGGATEIHIEDLLVGDSWAPPEYHENPCVHQSPSEIAYVIYTSGSTGRPKGVLLSHQAATTGLAALPLPPDPQKLRSLLCHSPTFSAAQRTILGTLSRGGVLCLASKENITSYLHETIKKSRVSSLEITPSMLRLLDPTDFPESVTRIILGGEPAGPNIVNVWASKVELYNGYGISECTQLNMRSRILPGKPHRLLGKPLDGTFCYILRPGTLSPVPANEPGELCLGGDQIAEGYLGLPQETQRTFIPNIFGRGRLCRTGDVVVLREDGSMELLGRADQQIKVDGQRVEPNESNNAIQQHPDVARSSVVAATVRGVKSLVALIVPKDNAQGWASLVTAVRKAVRGELQSFAIPRYWVKMETLPVSLNGKTDIRRLASLIESMSEKELMVPVSGQVNGIGGHLDSDVQDLVARVLSTTPEMVNPAANFEELGGTSLNAIVLTSKARSLGFHLAVPDLLSDITLHQIFSKRDAVVPIQAAPPKPFSLLPEGASVPNQDELADAYPATPLQEGILADSLLGSVNHIYQRVYRIQDKARLGEVKAALDHVVQKSPILRTVFKPWKRSFLQMVSKSVVPPWKEVPNGDLATVLNQLRSHQMELDGPMVRATVLSSEYLIVEMHHSIFDYWSSQFIFADMVASLKGESPIERAPFSGYVAYQQTRARDRATHSYWQKFLNSASETVLELSNTDKSGGSFHTTAALGDALTSYCHASHITMGTAVHQIWAFTLARHMSQTDVSFVTAASGRDADVDGILALDGPTLCTVPFRAALDASRELSAAAHGHEMQKDLWEVAKNAHVGLRNAAAAASLNPSMINTMVNVLTKIEQVDPDSPLSPVLTHGFNFTQYITLELNEDNPTAVTLLVPFVADKSAAKALLNTFVTIAKEMAADPEVPVSKLVVAKPEAAFGLAHSDFERIALAEPHRPAIRTKLGDLSYGKMNDRAERFAHYLHQQGIKHGDLVPTYMDKSAETLVAIFGILKAGAGFVPLDSHNPHERNKFILSDTGASLVITDKMNKEDCESFGLPTIVIEDNPQDVEPIKRQPVPGLSPDSTAYVIFTSGSTGTPKGVLVPHSAVDASTRGMIEATATTRDWVSLWVLNYIFDASYYDVFTVLACAAVLCVAPQDEILSDLAGHINDMGVEQVMLTPTITKLIRGGPSEVPRLKVLNVCGERIDTNILEWAKSVDVYNGYGPTEATILMTVSRVEPDGDLNSIGFPLKHVSAVILPAEDASLEPVKDGEVGELCVLGPQLAKGYLNRPEQTRKAFVQGSHGEPIYRTGDLAKWTQDGSLICLGRKDYQIKLNGFRIELGEIENAMLHTGKVEAVVVSVAELHKKRQLVAFCIFKGDQRTGTNEPINAGDRLELVQDLMDSLGSLAHYMMPSLFLPYNSFPTLPSGKANRKALVAQVESMSPKVVAAYLPSATNAADFVPVSTEQERVMQKAWAVVLDEPEESIGASSSFRSIGGDSIAAINVVAQCRSLGYGISVGQLLAQPTLAEQAAFLSPLKKKTPGVKVEYTVPDSLKEAIRAAPHLKDEDIEQIYPCGPGQIEFLTQDTKQEQFWNLTTSRPLPQDFDLDYWKEVTRRMTAANEILRAFYYKANTDDTSSWYQIILREPVLDWEEREYASEEEKTEFVLGLRDSYFEFGMPTVKYLVLCSQVDQSRTLCVKIDHATYDGTLLRIFDEQFLALASGNPMPEIINFKNYISWHQSEDRQKHVSYWTSLLDTYEPPTAVNLPLEPVSDRLKFATLKADVDAVADKFGVTGSSMFQAAYALVTGRLLVQTTDVLVDNLITGRNAEVDNPQQLNGTCANFLPFRTRLDSPATPVMRFLKDIQDAFWDSTEHGAVGLNDIYKALGRDRQVHSSKLLFCYQPFDPVPPGVAVNHMRWVVMAQSKVFMVVNYALMVEVQKTLAGYRLKLQWDSRAFSEEKIDEAVEMFEAIFRALESDADMELGSLI